MVLCVDGLMANFDAVSDIDDRLVVDCYFVTSDDIVGHTG